VTLSVDGARLRADLEELGRIGRVPEGGISRTSFSDADRAARAWYLSRCAEAGLSAVIDGIGNIIVSSPAVPKDVAARPAVWSGSHIDTVPNGGQFDGALGSLAALECLRRIHESGTVLDRPVRAVVYTDEEGNYAHLLGSSALVRGFSRAELEAMTGRDGDRFADAFIAAGGDLDAAATVRVDPSTIHATVELHIEQGPVLEQRGHDIGLVTGIVGLGGGTLTFRGRADHAGTTPMNLRKDALRAAAELLASLPEIAASISDRAVITSGIVHVQPGSANVVPGIVTCSIDYRDLDPQNLDALGAAITAAAHNVAAASGVEVEVDFEPSIPPAPLDAGIRAIIAESAASRDFVASDLPSGAGHDSQNLATIAPTAMIFVPSIDGRSHCPEEDTAWRDVENGANVLLDTLIALATN